jgi:hypothetical protein
MTASSTESSANLTAISAKPSEANAHLLGADFELDSCLNELAQVAQTKILERDFYSTLLNRIVRLLAAEEGRHGGSAKSVRTLISQVRFLGPH